MYGSTKLALAAVAAASFVFAGCAVEKTQEGEMPDVKVEGGKLPEYDVKTADIDLGTTETTVTVPTADVTMPQ